ncbi:DUF1917-domain-containing protein [Aspergillus taichungensis]|uniref:DUF1917-domain-containing protein n=1 Tax=Aspergillus taichungensis TaxID=482145 RepID=A0A2J5HJT3_9EURO|nr:DUF1917-domain-containing protein [Aspergillus taichungensis]
MDLPSEDSNTNNTNNTNNNNNNNNKETRITNPPKPPNRRHPTESIDEFFSRLAPYKTKRSTAGPWIYISGPLSPPTPDRETLVRDGKRLLRAYENDAATLSAKDHSCDLTPLREDLERRLFALARETGVVSGMWVLPAWQPLVSRFWQPVARATAEGQLGFEAKISTNPVDGPVMWSRQMRRIMVYTRDYADREDVDRVLRKLVELGVVFINGRSIGYRCEAYASLGIVQGNPYGLKVDLLSSSDVLGLS